MHIASIVLTAMLISDFLQARMPAYPAAPADETASSVAGAGDLLATLTVDPIQGSVPLGATRVHMATLNLSASCEADVTVQSVEFAHVGLGVATDITGLYLADGFRRVSRAGRFDQRSRTATLRAPSLKIPSCGAVRLSVLADYSPTAAVASEHGVTIAHAADIQSTAKNVTLSQDDSRERVVASTQQAGSITVTFLPTTNLMRYGRVETVARLQLTSDIKTDHLLTSITLTNTEGARDMDLIDLRLETRSGQVLTSNAARMHGRTVTLDFSPSYVLERGKTVVLLLKATGNASIRKKVDFILQEKSDLHSMTYRPERLTE